LGFLLLIALPACGAPPSHPNRVPLSGALNFRDVGGYASTDGRQVKRGVLYRSDDLADLSSQDLEMLAELGLRRVFDMRHESERLNKPNRLPGQDGIAVFEVPVYFPPLDRAESRRKILSAEVESGHFEQLLIEANRAFALDYTSQWHELVQGLTAPGALPALIHCVDGKDRTGFAVALILRAVGVPQEMVLEDYLLSNRFFQSRIDRYAFLGSLGSLFRLPSSEIRPLLEVRRAYLEAAFAAIDEQYGSFTAYLYEGLGLDARTLDLLRLALLE
jgi:protein-tyrosine phosphatase